MPTNDNRDYFRRIYARRWREIQPLIHGDPLHARYQNITLKKLQCFDGCSVLECGCGSGDLLKRLDDRFENLRITGIDLGRESLASAQTKLKAGRSTFIVGDIIELPFPSNQFDRILCSSVLWYLPDPFPVIKEMIRVLKPGGQFVFDTRNYFHITNLFAYLTTKIRNLLNTSTIRYSFLTPSKLTNSLQDMPIKFEIEGYFVLLPTRLPLLGSKWGNWARFSTWLSFQAGHGKLYQLAQKFLVFGTKIETS
jgi:ubiquinone/menaquinone biosynthesis C-methylase UbiE